MPDTPAQSDPITAPPPSSPGRASRGFRLRAPAFVFTVALLLTAAATLYVAETTQARERLRFEAAARQAEATVRDRLETYISLLRSGTGLFAASESVTRAEFHRFVEALDLPTRYPGIQGIGFSARVRRESADSLIRAMRGQGDPQFRVWPEQGGPDLHAIVYLEPQDRRNAVAMGYDMFSEPTRRAAMLRAWESGRAAASARVTLVQEIDQRKQAGFLIYYPVYRNGRTPETAEERRERLVGFIYSPFRVGDLMAGIFRGPADQELDLTLYDGAAPAADRLMYDSRVERAPHLEPAATEPSLTSRIDVAGLRWTLTFMPRADRPMGSDRDLPAIILGAGMLVSVALLLVTRSEASARTRAEAAARELRRSEEAVRASESRFRFLAEWIPQLVWSARPDGATEYGNARCLQYLGVTQPDFTARGWAPFVHADDAAETVGRWAAAVRTGAAYEIECRLRRASDRAYRWHLVRAAPLRNEAGAVTRWFGTCTDIDDARRASEALRQAQKLESIGVLAGGIAHDFNNLLTGIMGNTSLALGAVPDDHPARPMLEDALLAGERAAALTSQLLAYAGKGRFFLQPVDLGALVTELTALVRATIARKVAVTLDLPPDCPPVEGDASQIQQLVMNLVINGAEAIGDEAGAVTVRVRAEQLDAATAARTFGGFDLEPGPYVRLEVEDTGCGMDERTVAQIFDPFFTTKFTGRGLGLAAALGIVRGHKGAISIRSAPGRGSTFVVLLPAAGVPVAAVLEAPAVPPAIPGPVVVLLADDEELVRRAGQSMLERHGYEVLLAENGERALEIARSSARLLGLLLLDLTMPDLGGEEVTRRLRDTHPELPIVLMSGYGEQEALCRIEGVEVDGFLAKPFTDAQLLDTIARVLGNRVPQVD